MIKLQRTFVSRVLRILSLVVIFWIAIIAIFVWTIGRKPLLPTYHAAVPISFPNGAQLYLKREARGFSFSHDILYLSPIANPCVPFNQETDFLIGIKGLDTVFAKFEGNKLRIYSHSEIDLPRRRNPNLEVVTTVVDPIAYIELQNSYAARGLLKIKVNFDEASTPCRD